MGPGVQWHERWIQHQVQVNYRESVRGRSVRQHREGVESTVVRVFVRALICGQRVGIKALHESHTGVVCAKVHVTQAANGALTLNG